MAKAGVFFWSVVALPVCAGLAAVVTTVGGLAGVLAEPARLALVLIVSLPLVYRIWKSYRDLKVSAGRSLGLEPREARRLDVSSPETLQRSLERITAARHGT